MIKIANYLIPVLAVFILLPSAAQAGPMGPGRPPTVIVAKIGQADVAPTARYVGHVEAMQTVDLRARVEGFLEQIKFKEGAFVRAGDILFIIEQSAYKARVAVDGAGVARNMAELNRADSYLKRLKSASREAVSATDMDNAIAADLTAKASLAKAKADLTLARLDLSYTTIKAPISGRIGKTNYTVGNLVTPATGALARIVQIDPVRVLYSISENDLGAVRASIRGKGTFSGLLAPRLKLAGGRPYALVGRLDFIDNEVDATTGTIAIRAKFPNPNGTLIPGQYVTVMLKTSASKIMPIVPQAAVLSGKNGRFVLTVRHGIARPRPITIGTAVGSYWAVKSGLKAGDKIIVSGIQKVRPGMPVTVAPGMEKKR